MLSAGVFVRTAEGQDVFFTHSRRLGLDELDLQAGQEFAVTYDLTANLCPGPYTIGLSFKEMDTDRAVFVPTHELIVGGGDFCGGLVHMDPACRIESAQPAFRDGGGAMRRSRTAVSCSPGPTP